MGFGDGIACGDGTGCAFADTFFVALSKQKVSFKIKKLSQNKKSLVKHNALPRTNNTIRGATLVHRTNPVPSAGYQHIPRN